MTSIEKLTASSRTTKRLILFVDTFFACFTFYLSNLVIHNFEFNEVLPLLSKTIFIILFIRIMIFKLFKTDAVIVRYAGIADLGKIFYAVSVGSILIFISVSYTHLTLPTICSV